MSIPSSGSSTVCSASTISSRVAISPRLPEEAHFLLSVPREEVDALGEPDPVAAHAHHERVRTGAVREEADAAEEVAVRDAGRHHDHLAGREVLGSEDAVDVLDAVLR